MATISRIALFWRAFFAVLLSGSLATAASKDEADTWQSAAETDTADAYYRYLSLFPAGSYVDDAVAALARLGTVGTGRDIAPIRPSIPRPATPVGIY